MCGRRCVLPADVLVPTPPETRRYIVPGPLQFWVQLRAYKASLLLWPRWSIGAKHRQYAAGRYDRNAVVHSKLLLYYATPRCALFHFFLCHLASSCALAWTTDQAADTSGVSEAHLFNQLFEGSWASSQVCMWRDTWRLVVSLDRF